MRSVLNHYMAANLLINLVPTPCTNATNTPLALPISSIHAALVLFKLPRSKEAR